MTPNQELCEAEEAVAKELGTTRDILRWGIEPIAQAILEAAVRRELKLRAYERAVEDAKGQCDSVLMNLPPSGTNEWVLDQVGKVKKFLEAIP